MLTRVFHNSSNSASDKVNSLNPTMSISAVNHPGPPRRWLAVGYSAMFSFLLVVSAAAPRVMAQGAASAPRAASSSAKLSSPVAPVKPSNPVKTSFKSAWQELTPAQQLSLKPLAANWSTMALAERRKWIAMAANYSTLTPTEQATMHSRMTEWSALSQQQRTQARLNFAKSKQLSPTQKTATWQAYQALSAEEKKKLAISAPQKPKGAAAATKPVPSQKLVKIPVTRPTPKPASSAPAVAPALDRHTLLPHVQAQPAAVPASKN